ncbi:MAG: hypothetical protein HZA50_07845 [Planctomycetes bacterium]|nr:hypothetical protein [Planctomycetota bacterium]
MTEPVKLPLHDKHTSAGAVFGEQAGWTVPLHYRGAIREAAEVRARAGLFDMSHFGRIRIRGDQALDLLEKTFAAGIARQEDDTAMRTLACDQRGGIMDDGLLLRLEGYWLYICQPCNRQKMLDHMAAMSAGMSVKIDDQTGGTSQLAVVGPAAAGLLDSVLPEKVSDKPDGFVKVGSMMIAKYVAIRSSPCGLWGLQVIIPNMLAGQAWRFVTEKAGDKAVAPAGAIAADILRLEAGLPKYGAELNQTIDPITAGLDASLDFNHDFLGRQAIEEIRQKGPSRRLVGLIIESAGQSGQSAKPDPDSNPSSIPPQGAELFVETAGDRRVAGSITSATFSPVLEKTIAMACVAADCARDGTILEIQSSAQPIKCAVTTPPFVK